MFNVPQSMINEITSKRAKVHQWLVDQCNIYCQSAAMINGKHSVLSREDYQEYYKNFTWDINIEANPLETFIPCEPVPIRYDKLENLDDKPERRREFMINREIPAYERLAKRITLDELKNTLNPTHKVLMALDKGRVTLDDVIDDIFIYLCLFKYVDEISTARIQMFSNMSPIIEYVVDHIGYKDLKAYLKRDKIDLEKVEKYDGGIFFEQDYDMVCKFYDATEGKSPVRFDVDDLVQRLITNIVLKSDIYIILAIYLAAAFAISDFTREIESPCVKYVTDVLSII